MIQLGACAKFARLTSESEDRNLNSRESSFVAKHRANCESCRSAENSLQLSLNMLRSASLEAETPGNFDRRLIRKVKVQGVRESFRYWSPALVGCALAFLIVFASLDLLAARQTKAGVRIPSGTALRDRSGFPSFELNQIPRFDR